MYDGWNGLGGDGKLDRAGGAGGEGSPGCDGEPPFKNFASILANETIWFEPQAVSFA